MKHLKDLKCMRLMIVSLFCIVLFGPLSQMLAGKAIDVNQELKNRLLINCGYTPLKKCLGNKDLTLSTFNFKGSVMSSGIEYKFPTGVSVEDGELKVDDSLLKKPEALDHTYVRNYNQREQKMTMSLNGSVAQSESWSNSDSLKVSASLETEVKCLFGGSKVSFGVEYGHTWEHAESEENQKGWVHSLEITVGPREMVAGALMVQKLKLDIPYWFDAECTGKAEAVFKNNASQNWGVTIYEHQKFTGKSATYTLGNEKVLYVKNLFWTPFNDMISSIRINGNVRVEFYQHADFKGYKDNYTESCSLVLHNDVYSSFIIYLSDPQTIEFNLEDALPNKADRSFRINGTWDGVSATNCVAIIGPSEQLNEAPALGIETKGMSKKTSLDKDVRKEAGEDDAETLLGKIGGAAKNLRNSLDNEAVEKAIKDIEVRAKKSKKFIGKIIRLKAINKWGHVSTFDISVEK